MITFDIYIPGYAVTNDVMVTIIEIIDGDWTRNYDIVQHGDGGRTGDVWLWVHPVEDAERMEPNPIRHWINEDGVLVLSEEVTWDWKV